MDAAQQQATGSDVYPKFQQHESQQNSSVTGPHFRRGSSAKTHPFLGAGKISGGVDKQKRCKIAIFEAGDTFSKPSFWVSICEFSGV